MNNNSHNKVIKKASIHLMRKRKLRKSSRKPREISSSGTPGLTSQVSLLGHQNTHAWPRHPPSSADTNTHRHTPRTLPDFLQSSSFQSSFQSSRVSRVCDLQTCRSVFATEAALSAVRLPARQGTPSEPRHKGSAETGTVTLETRFLLKCTCNPMFFVGK